MHWHFTDFKKHPYFWEGFWSVFRHPLWVYAAGFLGGFVVRGWI